MAHEVVCRQPHTVVTRRPCLGPHRLTVSAIHHRGASLALHRHTVRPQPLKTVLRDGDISDRRGQHDSVATNVLEIVADKRQPRGILHLDRPAPVRRIVPTAL